MELIEARKLAIALSRKHECVQHVSALIRPDGHGGYCIVGYSVKDWSDDATVESYLSGTTL